MTFVPLFLHLINTISTYFSVPVCVKLHIVWLYLMYNCKTINEIPAKYKAGLKME